MHQVVVKEILITGEEVLLCLLALMVMRATDRDGNQRGTITGEMVMEMTVKATGKYLTSRSSLTKIS